MEQQFHLSGELGAMNENLFIEANQNSEPKSQAARRNRFQLVTYLETSNFSKAPSTQGWQVCFKGRVLSSRKEGRILLGNHSREDPITTGQTKGTRGQIEPPFGIWSHEGFSGACLGSPCGSVKLASFVLFHPSFGQPDPIH